MKQIIRLIIPPLISLAFVMLGNGFLTTFTSLRLSMENYSNSTIGLVNAVYYLGIMLGSIYIERLIDRIGHIRTFAIMASTNSIFIIFQGSSIGIFAWVLCRFFIGFCVSGFFIVIESWLLLSGEVKHRGRVLSFYMVTLYLSQGFGQFLLNIAPLKSLMPYVITILMSCVSVIPVSVIRSSGPLILESSMINIFQIVKHSPLGPIGCFVSGMILSAFYSLGPIFAKEINLSVFQISQFMGFTVLGGLLLQWPIGHLSDLFNRRKVIIGVTIFLMLTTIALYFSSYFHYYGLLCVVILFGGISFTLYPLSITYTCDHFSEKKIIGITCSLLIIFGTGCILGPLVAPLFMMIFGSYGLFLYMTILCLLFIAVCFWRVVHAKTLTEEEQSDYLPVPSATSMAFYLDPNMHMDDPDEFDDQNLLHHPFIQEYEEDDD